MTRPVVLVHGAWHGPWCWENITPGLEAVGHRVIEVELPGHGAPGTYPRNWSTISDYFYAIDTAVTSCPEAPVLVGHSMGGYLVQRYLEDNLAYCGVLVASAMLHGALEANLRTIRSHPEPALRSLATLDMAPLVATPAQVRELFFRPETPDDIVQATSDRLQNESALAINTMSMRWPRPKRVTVPMHVIAADKDGVFTVKEEQKLAAAYHAPFELITGSGHDIMLDTKWDTLLQSLLRIAAS